MNHAWHSHPVLTFNGLDDTHKHRPGHDYPTRTLAELFAMEPTDRPKDEAPAFIPSSYCAYDGRAHAVQQQRGYYVSLTADVDKGDHSLEDVETIVRTFADGSAYKVHSSASNRPGAGRWRGWLPLDAPMMFQEWADAQNALFDFMEAAGIKVDRRLALAGQAVFLPNVPEVHAKSGTPLRGANGQPLYYEAASTGIDAPGLRLDGELIAPLIAGVRQRRLADEAAREQLRVEAAARRAARGPGDTVIEAYNAAHPLDEKLLECGYLTSNDLDFQSPQQRSGTYATRNFGDFWTSLSGSDAEAGVGNASKSGRHGDAFDLYVFYDHGGDSTAAVKAAREEQMLAAFPPPPSAEDIAARVAAQALLDRLRAERVAAAEAGEAIEPVDLFGSFAPPPLPRGLLPPVIEQFAFGQGEYMGADPAGVAMAALTVCAAALPDSAKLRVKSGGAWGESARLWSALIGPPSTKKSPIINAAARPLKRIDGEMSRNNAAAMAAYKTQPKEEREAAIPPPRPRLRLEDVTMEAAGEVLKDSPDGLLVLQDELSGWFGSMEKYSGSSKGAAKDRSFWLQAFNGDEHTITRVGRGDVYIPNLSVCLLGGIQPETIRAVAATSSDDGLLQRLCPIVLQPAAVGREEEREPGAGLAYEALILRLRGMRGGAPYTFDAGAQALRRELEEEHFKWQKGFERINGRLASHIGKYDGIFARLCLLFHCCESEGYVIATDIAQRVGRFLHGFLMRHAISFYTDVLGLSSAQDEVEDTVGFILAHELHQMDVRIGMRSVRSLRGMEPRDIIRVLEQLEGLGWLIPTNGPRPSSRKWNVNPLVHVRFAERGSEEAERRRADGEMLREIFANVG